MSWLWLVAQILLAAHGCPAIQNAGDWNPGLGLGSLLFIFAMVVAGLILAGMGLLLLLMICALAGALAACGILSSSVAIAFLKRNPASGVKALCLQVGALAGVPTGIVAAWFVAWLINSAWTIETKVLMGGTGGLCCGLIIAGVFNFAWGKVADWIVAHHAEPVPEIPHPRGLR